MNKIKYTLFSLLTFFSVSLFPLAKAELGFCQEAGIQRLFKILGIALYIVKIVVPLLLIIFGIVEFTNAVIASDDTQIKKSTSKLVKKVIAGVVIFLIPTIITFIFNTVQQTMNNNSQDYSRQPKYSQCVKCFTNPKAC